ncbi:MAG: hypothetical protein JRN15_05640 [Nitrososphaerota archaeon]|nr:hypothetical protein [Nitrososphaerota archaeon]
MFKEGDIRAPLAYGFNLEGNMHRRLIHSFASNTIRSRILFTLNDADAAELERFIPLATSIFNNSSLKGPFKNFEDSYSVHTSELAFTSLMIGLESIFHKRGNKKIGEEISMNCSQLIAINETDRILIAKKLLKLYSKRNGIMHEGKRVEQADILLLRDYLRRSIKEIHLSGMNPVVSV